MLVTQVKPLNCVEGERECLSLLPSYVSLRFSFFSLPSVFPVRLPLTGPLVGVQFWLKSVLSLCLSLPCVLLYACCLSISFRKALLRLPPCRPRLICVCSSTFVLMTSISSLYLPLPCFILLLCLFDFYSVFVFVLSVCLSPSFPGPFVAETPIFCCSVSLYVLSLTRLPASSLSLSFCLAYLPICSFLCTVLPLSPFIWFFFQLKLNDKETPFCGPPQLACRGTAESGFFLSDR